MKKWFCLILILILSLILKYNIAGGFQSLPCSDVYYYMDTSNRIINSGSLVHGLHPTFNIFISEISIISGIDLIPLFFYFAPILNLIFILAIFLTGYKLYNLKVGIFSSFFIAITPIIFVRHSQLIAENLAISFFVLYFLYLWKLIEKFELRYLFMIILFFLGMFYAHDLTGGLAMLLSLVFIPTGLVLRKRYTLSLASILAGIIFLLGIFVLPLEKLPQFKEYYIPLYEMVKEYFSSFTYGSDITMPMRVYDLLLPTLVFGLFGVVLSFKLKDKGLILLLLFPLFLLTQAYRIGFNFVPHRFIVYLAIPLAILAGIFIFWIFEEIANKTLATGVICAVLGISLVYSFSYNFEYTVFVSDEDFQGLAWARYHCDGEIFSYSTIRAHEEKFEAISNKDVSFQNQMFNTGSIDFKLLQIVSKCFDIPITGNPSSDTVYYVGKKLNNDFIRLNGRDRTFTSLKIIETFWGNPDTVIVSDAVNNEQGVKWAMEYKIPLILYCNEDYQAVIERIEAWRCHVIMASKIPELSHVFDLKGIPYSFTPRKIKSYNPKEGVEFYFNQYNLDKLLANIKNYLYLSKEAETDFPDIENLLDDTYLDKIYNSGVSAFYIKITR